jgi:hypothetical protein
LERNPIFLAKGPGMEPSLTPEKFRFFFSFFSSSALKAALLWWFPSSQNYKRNVIFQAKEPSCDLKRMSAVLLFYFSSSSACSGMAAPALHYCKAAARARKRDS